MTCSPQYSDRDTGWSSHNQTNKQGIVCQKLLFLHSLWISWAATGLSCEQKTKHGLPFSCLQIVHMSIAWKSETQQLHALAERRTALKYCSCVGSRVVWGWAELHPEQCFRAWVIQSIPLQWGNQMALGRKLVWVPKSKM